METKSATGNLDVGELLQEVIDEMQEGLQVISPELRYLYVNSTVARQGKKTKEELTGKTMMECYPGIEDTPFFAEMKKCMAGRVNAQFENEFAYPDGTKGWFLLFLHPVPSGLMILSTDITDRKKIEHELGEKIVKLNTLMDSSMDREMRMAELKEELTQLKALSDSRINSGVATR